MMIKSGKIGSVIVASVLAIAMTSCEFSDSDKKNNKNTETESAESQVTRKNLLEDIKNELNESVSETKEADGISDSEDYSETEAVTEIEAPVTEKALEIIKDELAENKETIPGVTKAVVLPENLGIADYQQVYGTGENSYRILNFALPRLAEINILCRRDIFENGYVDRKGSDDPQHGYYLVEYDGVTGYMGRSEFDILSENSEEELSDEMLAAIARLRYLQAWHVSQPCIKYGSLVKCDDDKTIGEAEQKAKFCPEIHSSNDWLDKCYTFFSRKYSDMYDVKFMSAFESNFIEYEDEYYYRAPAIGGDIRLSDLTPLDIDFTVLSRKDNEVFFSGFVTLFSDKGTGINLGVETTEKIDMFSLVYEDGTWKCGMYSEL